MMSQFQMRFQRFFLLILSTSITLASNFNLTSANYQLVATLIHNAGILGFIQNPPDGKILTWSEDGTAKIWNYSGDELALLEHPHVVLDAKWDFEEHKIVTRWATGNAAWLWDDSGNLLAFLDHNALVKDINWLPTNSILTWSEDGEVKVWNTKGQNLAFFTHPTPIRDVIVDQTESLMAVLTQDQTVYLWNMMQKNFISIPNVEDVYRIEWSPDGKYVMGYSSYHIFIWDRNGLLVKDLIHTREAQMLDLMDGLAWNFYNNKIISWSAQGTLRIWSLDTPKITTLQHTGVSGASWDNPTGEILSWSDYDATIKLWDQDGNPLFTVRDQEVDQSYGETGVSYANWSPDYSKIVVITNSVKIPANFEHVYVVSIYDVNGNLLRRIPHQDTINGAVFDDLSTKVLSWGDDGTIQIALATEGGLETSPETINTGCRIQKAEWGEDEGYILTLCHANTLKIWGIS